MARNQIIYNVEDVFIGPCPASGYHFINYSGQLNNNYEDFPYVTYESFQHISPNTGVINAIIPKDKNENTFPRNHNLLKRLDRIQDVSYEIISTRTPISEIGRATVLDKIQLNKPEISLSFSYILSSLRNEARMGFDVNYPRLDYPYTGDKYFYRTDNGEPLFLFSGFFDRNYSKKYPLITNRGEGTEPQASPPCFQFIQQTSPNPNVISNYIPFWIGKNLSPVITFVNLNLTDVAAGFYHLLALVNGRITGWGDNTEGQITNTLNLNDGSGQFTGNWNDTLVGKLDGVKKISTNYLHNLAILSGDTITGWGPNDDGQAVGTTGYNDINNLFTGNWNDAPISSITGASGISAGAYHSLVLLNDKTITGWGDNSSGQALNGNNLTGIISISAGGYHSLAIRNISGGLVTGWGDNEYGQALSGNNLTGVRMISAGHLHSFALLNNGKVTGWGWNDDGQIAGTLSGNNSSGIFTGNWNLTPVGQLTGVKSIHAGWFHTLALLENNKITGWGFNNAGQLNENISYNDINGIFTGDWNSTIVGSFSNVLNIDTSAQNSISLISGITKEITGWGETDADYDLIKNQIFLNDFEYNEYDCITNDPYWPLSTKDKRNIFIAISDKEVDHNDNYENFDIPDKQDQINVSADRKSQTTNTIGIGNCYLTSYSQTAVVGNFIRANVSYLGENMLFQMSGSGARTPYVDPKTYLTNSGNNSIKFNIPGEVDNRNPIAALLPGDIEVEIYSSNGYGLNFGESHVQGYEFNFSFNRENFSAIGYKLPIDREINLPLTINLSIDFSLGDHIYNDLADLVNLDENYRVIIKCRNNQRCDSVENYLFSPTNQSSEFEKRFDYAFIYEFSNLKFENINYSNQIGARKTAKINFSTEINTENYNQGLQMSGLLGIDKIEDFILIESGNLPALPGASAVDGSYLLQEDENLLVSNLSVLY